MRYSLIGLLMFLGSSALADCACFCADGELRTMCTSVAEAQHSAGLCVDAGASACLDATDPMLSTNYESPEAGALNCRDVRIWNPQTRVHLETPACDVDEELSISSTPDQGTSLP